MQLEFMEDLLRLEAEVKYFLGATDRAYEQSLMDELLKIIDEAELLFGPRDRSYELLAPRITECSYSHPYIHPFRKIRIYLTSDAKDRFVASYTLAHEAVEVAGVEPDQAMFLCTDFHSYGHKNQSWSEVAAEGYSHVVNGFRAIWD